MGYINLIELLGTNLEPPGCPERPPICLVVSVNWDLTFEVLHQVSGAWLQVPDKLG
jgi:hypothetical protein